MPQTRFAKNLYHRHYLDNNNNNDDFSHLAQGHWFVKEGRKGTVNSFDPQRMPGTYITNPRRMNGNVNQFRI